MTAKNPPMTAKRFIAHQIDARHAGGILVPAVSRDFAGYPVTFGYRVKDPFGSLGYHTGEDHACPDHSYAVATSYGKVVYRAFGGGTYGAPYGNILVVRSETNWFDEMYCHLSAFHAEVGDKVVPGQILAYTGHTGNVTGPHLHYEVRPAGGHFGSDINPLYGKQKGHHPGTL